jgi:hypothetical protein
MRTTPTEEEVMNARQVLIPVLASFALAASAAPAGAAAGGGQSEFVAPCLAFFTSNDPQGNGELISGLAPGGDLGSFVIQFSHERPC